MNAALKKRWIKALRSGKYIQSQNNLRDDKGYCCLGVLCDLLDSSKWTLKQNRYEFDNRGAFIPGYLREEIGLSDEDENTLAVMNDSKGRTFRQIADYIQRRKNL